jgi:transposase-like protein
MGHGIKLTEQQWDELDRVRLTTDSANLFRNCLIILMSDSRDTIAAIAQRLGCGTDTVVRIRRLYRKGGAISKLALFFADPKHVLLP